MTWVRDVLTGEEKVDASRHGGDVYRWLSDFGEQAPPGLHEAFGTLIFDDDDSVRGAAMCWFAQHEFRVVGSMLVAAWVGKQRLYEGIPQPWLPDAGDQGDLMRIAIARNALDTPSGLDIARDAAMRPDRGQQVLAFLLYADAPWVRDNLPLIVTRSPACIELLFHHLELQDVDTAETAALLASEAPEVGDTLLRALHARGADLEQPVLRLSESLGTEPVRAWIDEIEHRQP